MAAQRRLGVASGLSAARCGDRGGAADIISDRPYFHVEDRTEHLGERYATARPLLVWRRPASRTSPSHEVGRRSLAAEC